MLHPSSFNKISVIGCIESFEVTFTIHLLFTGFEHEKEIVSMVLTDIGNTAPESLDPNCVLLTVFTFLFFCHSYLILEFFH